MLKTCSNFTRNGCHIHCSIWDKHGNIHLYMDQKRDLGLSISAYHFIGEILKHAKELCALTNATVDSYQRLNPRGSSSGSTWAPNTLTYGGNNKSHIIKIPDSDRIEFRLPDGDANPYTLQRGVLAAGFLGITEKKHPERRRDDNAYNAYDSSIEIEVQLPSRPIEALIGLEKDSQFTSFLGNEFVKHFIQLKQSEEVEYQKQVFSWGLPTTVDS